MCGESSCMGGRSPPRASAESSASHQQVLLEAEVSTVSSGGRGRSLAPIDLRVGIGELRFLGGARVARGGREARKHRAARLMRESGLRALYGYQARRREVGKPAAPAPNLLKRGFSPTKRNVAWATDITYIRKRQGLLYLALVLDLLSRKLAGWAVGPTTHQEQALYARALVLSQRRRRGTIIRSDRGVQFAPVALRRFVAPIGSNRARARKKLLGPCRGQVVLQQLDEGTKRKANLSESRHRAGRNR